MEAKLYRSSMSESRGANRWLLALCVLLGLALVANGLFRRSTILHVTPVEIENTYWASAFDGSEEYKRKMALTLLPCVTNVTPKSVKYMHDMFLNYVAPDSYGIVSDGLAIDRNYVIKSNLNRMFFPDEASVNGSTVIVKGHEKRFIGHQKVAEERRAYELKLHIQNWKVHIVGLRAGGVGSDGTPQFDVGTDQPTTS
ncbi:MAG: hypothetical protein NPIRA04_05660 [Nitrospirales bacterium]|nr:MAG: hypothetical protein NPIRA04_05660 [Nitrospirales bacterium]